MLGFLALSEGSLSENEFDRIADSASLTSQLISSGQGTLSSTSGTGTSTTLTGVQVGTATPGSTHESTEVTLELSGFGLATSVEIPSVLLDVDTANIEAAAGMNMSLGLLDAYSASNVTPADINFNIQIGTLEAVPETGNFPEAAIASFAVNSSFTFELGVAGRPIAATFGVTVGTLSVYTQVGADAYPEAITLTSEATDFIPVYSEIRSVHSELESILPLSIRVGSIDVATTGWIPDTSEDTANWIPASPLCSGE